MSAELISGVALAVFGAILTVNGWMAVMMFIASKDIAVMKNELQSGSKRFDDLENRVRDLEKEKKQN